jgi:hypothetical protein
MDTPLIVTIALVLGIPALIVCGFLIRDKIRAGKGTVRHAPLEPEAEPERVDESVSSAPSNPSRPGWREASESQRNDDEKSGVEITDLHEREPPTPSNDPAGEPQFIQANQAQTSTRIPPPILAKLKQHKEHHPDVTCLECGYQGMMGLKSRGVRPFLSMFWAILITLGFAWMGLWGLVISPALLGVSWVVIMNRTTKPIVICPNCDNDLAL